MDYIVLENWFRSQSFRLEDGTLDIAQRILKCITAHGPLRQAASNALDEFEALDELLISGERVWGVNPNIMEELQAAISI